MAMKADAMERAEALLKKAEAAGCKPHLEGNWVVFRPSLPVDLILDAGPLGGELVKLVGKQP